MPPKKLTKADERHIEMAVLSGAGKTHKEIAKAVGITRSGVTRALGKSRITEEMLEAREEAVAALRDKAIGLLAKHLDTLDVGLSEDGVAVRDVAAGVRELRETAMPRNLEAPWMKPQQAVNIQTDNPAVMASFVEALRMLNEPSGRVIEAEAVSEEAK